ncbi:hypothetical protein FZD51_19710 [Bacillus infantis]|uniref:Uncharacterized protein n=1 Tax=Bacillus infantis TaxID=324767 RepID=A0A5D4R6V7_9BACI|nr:hypothetical protein FZD51_19710 [Bacillus infantis]
MEGTQTPVGDSGNVETPQRASARRLNSAPRKAKCLERKLTTNGKADTFSQKKQAEKIKLFFICFLRLG